MFHLVVEASEVGGALGLSRRGCLHAAVDARLRMVRLHRFDAIYRATKELRPAMPNGIRVDPVSQSEVHSKKGSGTPGQRTSQTASMIKVNLHKSS
jgi:hypothetical protein